ERERVVVHAIFFRGAQSLGAPRRVAPVRTRALRLTRLFEVAPRGFLLFRGCHDAPPSIGDAGCTQATPALGRNDQSGNRGTANPWSRPSRAARVTLALPNRSRTSSSAASSATRLRRSNGKASCTPSPPSRLLTERPIIVRPRRSIAGIAVASSARAVA